MNNHLNIKKIAIKTLRWIRNIFLLLFSLSLFFVIIYKYAPVYYTAGMFSKNMEQLFNKEKVSVKHQWTPLDSISQNLVQAVIAADDNLFLIHNGFDFNNSETNPGEISRSRYKWKTGTLSQQTARAVFLFQGRNYINKILESYFTVLIEFVWGKERIMEVYLNSVEFGNGIFGAESIARTNFNVSAGELNAAQSALITVSIDNPKELDSSCPTTYMLRRQAKIISLMEKMIQVEYGKSQKNTQK
ncbi:MAG: monofunctional biosynthetic peptidoglycan transglycosylase [Dysgonamonadaceae bacterium]|jgi:monofunctional biosynthetic peptidoglycan transglycosylase|nr:monofunctional biosynthetic peptidoglycan transglycosylase [Dysgonamonadaceae bacterium]